MRRILQIFLATAFVIPCGLVGSVRAQTWIGTFSGSWNNASNWSTSTVPASSRDTQLTFGATNNGVMTNDIPVPPLNVFLCNTMTFTGVGPQYMLAGNTLSFQNATGGNAAAIVMNNNNAVTIADPITLQNNFAVSGTGAGTVTLSGVIAGAGVGLTEAAPGILALTANNTYTGATVVNQGATLAIPTITNGSVAGPLGASSNAVGNLTLGTVGATRGNLVLTGTNAAYGTDRGVSVLGASATLGAAGGAIGVQNAGTTLTWNGQITGSGTLIKSGAGTLTLTNTANNWGTNTVIEGGTLAAGANGAVFPIGSSVTVQSGATFDLGPYSNASAPVNALGPLTLNGGTLRATGATNSDFFVKQLTMSGGTIDFTNLPFTWIHMSAGVGITINANPTPSTWIGGGTCRIQNDTNGPLTISAVPGATLNAGIILSNGGTNPNFTISGGGIVRLSNTGNTANITLSAAYLYSNDLSTNVGTGAFGTLGTGTVAITNGGFLYYDGPTASSAKPLTVSNATIEVVTPNVSLTMTGLISESAPGSYLQVLGPAYSGNFGTTATLTFAGNNNYSGQTFVGYGDILAIPTIANGGVASPIGTSTSAPGNLVLGYSTSIGRGDLLLTGTAANYSTDRGVTIRGQYYYGTGGGAIGVQNAGTTLTWNGPITGSDGELVKTGAGTLVLTNTTNNYGNGTVIEAGTLTISGANGAGILPAGSSVAILGGAQLNYAAFIDYTQTANALGTVFNEGGTFRLSGSVLRLNLNQLWCYTGSNLDLSQSSVIGLNLINPGAAINILGNSTWTGPGSYVFNTTTAEIPITITQGATLTSSVGLASNLDLTTFFDVPYRVTGGGALYLTGLGNASTNIIVSQGRLRVDSFTPLQNTSVVLDGGTFQFSGPTASQQYPIYLTANGGTVEVSNAATTLTLTGYIGSIAGVNPGPFTKAGPGALALTNVDTISNRFLGGVTVNAGRLEIGDDAVLGAAATITVNQLGTLRYTASTTTARTFLLNNGTLDVSSGATLTLNGATVGGGFIHGPGTVAVTGGTSLVGVTTSVNSVISQTSSGSYTNFTSGGALTIAAGITGPIMLSSFTNQGSGSITVGATTPIGVSDFQSYGTLTISPATVTENYSQTTKVTNVGTSPLYINGGSRTFIGTPQTAVFPVGSPQAGMPTFVAGIDLNGKNAIVAGGLFVNNGYVEDSSNGFAGTATIVADFGSLVKGAGFFQNTVQTVNGGKFQAGNSPGSATFGKFVLGSGGVSSYVFAIDDATGAAGPTPDAAGHVSGWGLVRTVAHASGSDYPGDFVWTATPAGKLLVSIETLVNPTTVGADVPGLMEHFDPTRSYAWPAVEWSGSFAGPADVAALDAATAFDTSGFANPLAGRFGWQLDAADQTLSLIYTPSAVPEPGTLALIGLAATGLAALRRRRRGSREGDSQAHSVAPFGASP